jgi:hypothetical protein
LNTNLCNLILDSSGTYSGGIPVFKKIAADEWAKLINVFQNAKTNAI